MVFSYLLLCLAGINLQVTGAPPLPDLEDTLSVSGTSLSQDIQLLQNDILRGYLDQGYPFASVVMYFSSPDTLVINAVPGRHALLEEIRFPDSVRTRREILVRSLRLAPGEPYSQQEILKWIDEMERLPFVESAGPCGVYLGQGGNIVLLVPVEEAPPGWFSGDLDFTSSGGLNGGGEIVFTNLFGTGRRLELYLSSVEWGGIDASGLYREPWIFNSPLSVQIEASQQVPDSGSVIRELSSALILSLGRIEVSGGWGTWNSSPVNSPKESYRYGSAGLTWDLTRRVPQGRAGFSGEIETDAGSASGADSTYFLTRAQGRMVYDWFKGSIGLGGEVSSGGILSGEWLPSMVTRIGGYGSLRGYVRDSWRAGAWVLGTGEVSLGDTPTRLYIFSDAGILNTGDGGYQYPVSAGIGLRGYSSGLSFDAGTAFPVDRGLGSARFYLSARINI